MKNIVSLLLIVSIIIISFFIIGDICKYPEIYSPMFKNSLRMDLEKGREDAINYYIEQYISRGKVLFDGPVSQTLWHEHWGPQSIFPKKNMTIFHR